MFTFVSKEHIKLSHKQDTRLREMDERGEGEALLVALVLLWRICGRVEDDAVRA
jgi:hypothetical protein